VSDSPATASRISFLRCWREFSGFPPLGSARATIRLQPAAAIRSSEFVRLFLLGNERQAENLPPASRQQTHRKVGFMETLLDDSDRAPSRFVEAGADHVVEGLLNTVALGCRLRVIRRD